ncbi:unnamed protein product [Kuraishia capsulata CBS 1993]|uniref:Uncharacterized protein n=1 Tax=Kuraishia capsulata CBS 1993 TaxID=1382522 RepID=W6MFC3_9ASCO|nr:uncharacterized protein KUCA_T00000427001 [Kuraishia capsulata CBS 1993]CDK24464.1 unnamed protein product [Kuraishia capsulata CBS 1993]
MSQPEEIVSAKHQNKDSSKALDSENTDSNANRELLIKEALELTDDLRLILQFLKVEKRSVQTMENENKYLQEYVGNLMASGKIES